MVILKSPWWGLQDHTVALDVMAYGLLRRAVEHLQGRMTCREAMKEALADDMRDAVTKRIERALIRYSPHVNTMELRPQPAWWLRQTEGAEDGAMKKGAPDGAQEKENSTTLRTMGKGGAEDALWSESGADAAYPAGREH